MSRISRRRAVPPVRESAEARLARLQDTPAFARVVAHLPPEALHRLVRLLGLEACHELVTSATPAQLASVLDLDLWRSASPGRDEQFDVDRFGEWLEALVDAGSEIAARIIASIDQDVVVAGLSRYVRVLDPGIFEPTAQSDDEASDRHAAMREGDSIAVGTAASAEDAPVGDPGVGLECELGGYLIRARRADAWDAILSLLSALGVEHEHCFDAVMQGCRRLSNSRAEIDGLDDLLPAPEQHLHDVTIGRERRRAQRGYATPADARAYLRMARQPACDRAEAAATPAITVNPIVAAYFRAADEVSDSPPSPAHTRQPMLDSAPPTAARSTDRQASGHDGGEAEAAVVELLIEVGVMADPVRAIAAADADPGAVRLTPLRRLLNYVRDNDEPAYVLRGRELAFLANTLLAGCSVQSRPFTPREASDAAASICNLGLEHWTGRWPATMKPTRPARPHDPTAPTLPDAFLVDHSLVTAFEAGWAVLHQDVSLFVAERLIATLDDIHVSDGEIDRELVALRRALARHREAGTPWLARDAADVLATLDVAAWTSVLGLLAECPVVPEALTAILEGRATAVNATAFEFISTQGQIGEIHAFMRRLPDVLASISS
jgi:hypothetical protein